MFWCQEPRINLYNACSIYQSVMIHQEEISFLRREKRGLCATQNSWSVFLHQQTGSCLPFDLNLNQGFTKFIMVHKIIKIWKTHVVVELGLPPCWLFCFKGKDTKVRMVLKGPKPREIAKWLQMWRLLYMQHGDIQWSWMSLMEICVLGTLWFIFLHQCQSMYAIVHNCRHDVNFMHTDKFASWSSFNQKI